MVVWWRLLVAWGGFVSILSYLRGKDCWGADAFGKLALIKQLLEDRERFGL